MHKPSVNKPAAVEVRDLRVNLGGQNVLDGVSLSVPAGQLICTDPPLTRLMPLDRLDT